MNTGSIHTGSISNENSSCNEVQYKKRHDSNQSFYESWTVIYEYDSSNTLDQTRGKRFDDTIDRKSKNTANHQETHINYIIEDEEEEEEEQE